METFTTQTTHQAWNRIFFALLFGFVSFWLGYFLQSLDLFFLSNFFFLFVGVLAYIVLDALLYFFTTRQYSFIEHRTLIVAVVFLLLFHITFLFGFVFFL